MRQLIATPILAGMMVLQWGNPLFAADLADPNSAGYKDSAVCDDSPEAMRARLTEINKTLGFKGWDVPYFPMQDSMLKDYGCWRSELASYGIGVQWTNAFQTQRNLLQYPEYGTGPSLLPSGKQTQQYFGQRSSDVIYSYPTITYDLGHIGIPDGQLQIGGYFAASSMETFAATTVEVRDLSYHQYWFGGKLETKVGYFAPYYEFIGAYVGSNATNPLGASAAVPVEFGLGAYPGTQPGGYATWHITDNFYDQFGMVRSLNPLGAVINGKLVSSGSILYDNRYLNKDGLSFDIPDGKPLIINEFGYKNEAKPGEPKNWLRIGYMYNETDFHNYAAGITSFTNSNPATTPVKSDVSSLYALYDRQLWQKAPGSAATAYQGIYAGASYYYGPQSVLPIASDTQLRLYGFGLIPFRPYDQITVAWDHNLISKDYKDDAALAAHLRVYPVQNVTQIGYTAKVGEGWYATLGLVYTDHPALGPSNSINKITGLPAPDAHALNASFALITSF